MTEFDPAPFDPARHRMVPQQRWFEDFALEERFVLPSRTMTEAIFLAFQAASGDNHPVHYDAEYCRARGMDEEEAVALVVNGFCKEVLQALPMEFAMEAQSLVAISLEGSVG